MRWIRHKPKEDARPPIERLWHTLGELFEDKDALYAGPDVGLDDLSGADVLRIWNYLSGGAKRPDSDLIQLWDLGHEAVADAPPLTEAAALVASGEFSYMMVALDGVESCGVLLPSSGLSFGPMRCRCTGGWAPVRGMPRPLALLQTFSANCKRSYLTRGNDGRLPQCAGMSPEQSLRDRPSDARGTDPHARPR